MFECCKSRLKLETVSWPMTVPDWTGSSDKDVNKFWWKNVLNSSYLKAQEEGAHLVCVLSVKFALFFVCFYEVLHELECHLPVFQVGAIVVFLNC